MVADFFMYAGRGLDPRVQGFVKKQLAKEKLPVGPVEVTTFSNIIVSDARH